MDSFSALTKYFKAKEVNTERGIFSLFSRGSVALCLFGAILAGGAQGGNSIGSGRFWDKFCVIFYPIELGTELQ